MRVVKNLMMGIGAGTLAAALVNLFAPQAVHATVAALVDVANTAGNPALTSRIDDPGRIPYQAIKHCLNNCNPVTFGPVLANHRLVVEHISAISEFAGLVPSFYVHVDIVGGSSVSTFLGNSLGVSFFDQPVHFYVDQNQSFTVDQVAGFVITQSTITVTGYLLDCNVAPCSAVASF
jgi:hypothetical protein